MRALVLASSSPYRQIQLQALGYAFTVCVPDIDESAHAGETAEALVARLAEAKARRFAFRFPRALWIGGDQVLQLDTGRILGKPGTYGGTVAMLQEASGRRVEGFSGICVWDPKRGCAWGHVERISGQYRVLTLAEIEAYVRLDRPYGCCGGVKIEAAGISLFEWIESRDPSAIVGMPLIALSRALRHLAF